MFVYIREIEKNRKGKHYFTVNYPYNKIAGRYKGRIGAGSKGSILLNPVVTKCDRAERHDL